jgi:hypothetical protein
VAGRIFIPNLAILLDPYLEKQHLNAKPLLQNPLTRRPYAQNSTRRTQFYAGFTLLLLPPGSPPNPGAFHRLLTLRGASMEVYSGYGWQDSAV